MYNYIYNTIYYFQYLSSCFLKLPLNFNVDPFNTEYHFEGSQIEKLKKVKKSFFFKNNDFYESPSVALL